MGTFIKTKLVSGEAALEHYCTGQGTYISWMCLSLKNYGQLFKLYVKYIMALQSVVGPGPLFQFLIPTHTW
jgi:hypothetical protein